MSGRIRLDPVRYEDPAVTTLVDELQAEYVARYGGPDDTPVDPAGFAPPGGAFWLVRRTEDGTLIGCAGLRRHDGETAEMKRMFVRRPFRGGGLGRELLVAVEQLAAGLGYRRLILYTGPSQPEALALYRSADYRLVPNFGFHADQESALSYAKTLTTPG